MEHIQELHHLFAHFNRKLTESTKITWSIFLDKNLSKKEIKLAIAKSILEDKYLPSAADLVAKIKGTHEENALEAWAKVVNIARNSSQLTFSSYSFFETDLVSFYALQNIGGLSLISESTSFERRELKEIFFYFHIKGSKASDIDTLIDWSFKSSPQYSAYLKSKQPPDEQEEFVPMTPEQFSQLRQKMAGIGKSFYN